MSTLIRSNADMKDAMKAAYDNVQECGPGGDIPGYGALKDWDTSAVTDMSNLQEKVKRLNSHKPFQFDCSLWNVSNVTTMANMFGTSYGENVETSNFDVSKWNVSKCTDMSDMFQALKDFNCDLSDWDVSNVQTFSYMFANCRKFNGNVSNWRVKRCNDFTGMFWNCETFDQDLSRWAMHRDKKPDEVQHHVTFMFVGADLFLQSENRKKLRVKFGWEYKAFEDLTLFNMCKFVCCFWPYDSVVNAMSVDEFPGGNAMNRA